MILQFGATQSFEPSIAGDKNARLKASRWQLLDEFAVCGQKNLSELRAMHLRSEISRYWTHPASE